MAATKGAIDCDIHPAVPNARVLLPYMDEYWREHMLRRGLERENFDLMAYPPAAPINVRPDWKLEKGPAGSSLSDMQAHVLDPMGTGIAICNVLHGAQALMSEDLSAAFCRGVNNWVAAEWLDRDPRLRASILVPQHSGELAAEEIERLAGDRRFVQVLMLSMAELPLGRRQTWPIYRAAEKHGLPIGIHAGSTFRHPPSAGVGVDAAGGLYLVCGGVCRGVEFVAGGGGVSEVSGFDGGFVGVRGDVAAGEHVADQQDLARGAQ